MCVCVPLCLCGYVSVLRSAHGFINSHRFICVFFQAKETGDVIQSAFYGSTEQTSCAGSYVFYLQTDSRTNKHHSLLTYVVMYLVPPVSFYLKVCWVTSSSVLDLKTPHLVCVSSIMDTRITLVSIPEALGAFQCIFVVVVGFFLSRPFCFTHCGSNCLLTSLVYLSWYRVSLVSLWKSIVLLKNWK